MHLFPRVLQSIACVIHEQTVRTQQLLVTRPDDDLLEGTENGE